MNKRVSLTLEYNENDEGSTASSNEGSSTNLSKVWTAMKSVRSQTSSNVPTIWERITAGYRIVDLRYDWKSLALDLITSHFFIDEPMSSATLLPRDVDSLKSYRQFVKKSLVEEKSVCAIREGEGSLVGIAVMSICRKKTDYDNRASQGAALYNIMTIKQHLLDEMQLQDKLADLEDFIRIDVLFVKSEHRKRGVGTGLLRSCIAKTRSLNVSACMGVFSSDSSQRIAGRLGFEKIGEITYATYVPEDDRENPFADIGTGNHSLACMIVKLNSATRPTDSLASSSLSNKMKK